MELDRNGLEVLDREESLRLLGTAVLGRIAVTSAALPLVLPVNFRFDGRQVLIRTSPAATSPAMTAAPAKATQAAMAAIRPMVDQA